MLLKKIESYYKKKIILKESVVNKLSFLFIYLLIGFIKMRQSRLEKDIARGREEHYIMTKGWFVKDTAILKMHAHSKKRFKLHEAKLERMKKETDKFTFPIVTDTSLTVTDSISRHRIHKGVQIWRD